MKEQTTFNTDSLENLVKEGEIENVQDADEQTEEVDGTV